MNSKASGSAPCQTAATHSVMLIMNTRVPWLRLEGLG